MFLWQSNNESTVQNATSVLKEILLPHFHEFRNRFLEKIWWMEKKKVDREK